MYESFGIANNLEKLAIETEEELKDIFKDIEKRCTINSMKVLSAFQNNKISDMHFGSTTGYGYNDIGRDTIEKVFAEVFKAEDSLVRTQFISGTHAITVCLFALLRPGDTLLSICGKPYDTLDKVIGLVENESSLKAYKVNYEQIDLVNNDFDIPKIVDRVKQGNVKLIEIQRSRGYDLRHSLTIDKIEKVIKAIKEANSEVIIMVDNCYGEFVDEKEPIELGADIMVGSLIKNLGGGLAPNGAYIVGKAKLVNLAAERLTSPGQGKEVGPTLGINKNILQGLYMAPSVVASSLKTAVFTSKMLEKLGYNVQPKWNERRADIVQTIEFGNEDDLVKYCQGIQAGSAIDSNSVPMPWDMPGYNDKVIMAAGAFTMGSSIELSCDAPIRPPYVAFQQGALTYEYGKLGVLKAIQNIKIIRKEIIMQKVVILASNNKNKLEEISKKLAEFDIKVISQKEAVGDIEVEETGITFSENAILKAEQIFKLTGRPVIADDSGLAVDYLNGAPGVYSNRFAGPNATDDDRIKKIIEALENAKDEERTARFICSICYIDETGKKHIFENSCEGTIAKEKHGNNGFGYDPIFMVGDISFAQMSKEDKNKISHRGKAIADFVNFIREQERSAN